MLGLLSLKKEMHIQIERYKGEKETFLCTDIINFENALNYPATRYLLEKEDQSYLLDVQKNKEKSISLTCYELIEEMDFDMSFLSLVGTSPLGYHHPQMPNIDYVLYEGIEKYHHEHETIKFMVTEEELPKDPKAYGYYQDGNGHWYFLSQRTKGTLLQFDDTYRLAWEYKQEKNERLLIELEAYTNMREYLQNKPDIYIYEGVSLARKDIKILHKAEVLEPA